jgi:uncharacterized SAM-binding protein YcdF (DUF218 family)
MADVFRSRRLDPRTRLVFAALAVLIAWSGIAAALDRYGRDRQVDGRWDAIVVAGARVWHGGEPSDALTRRTEHAVRLWRRGVAPTIVLTGGVGENPPAEAVVAAGVARALGVPDSALRLERSSKNTEENARFARAMLGDKRVLVVTDAYHVLRSEWIYRRHFRDAQVVGVVIGWRPPVRASLREVAALGWYGVQRALH